MKLNLGSRTTRIPGFSNVDKDPHEGVDIVSDVSDLPVEDNSVDEIYASHILEHFPHRKTLEVLDEWHRVLKPGGELKIAVPDFDTTVRYAMVMGLNDWVVNFLWGDQEYDGAFHYTGFNEDRLTGMLHLAGFYSVSRVNHFGMVKDCSTLAFALPDGGKLSVSLNLIAKKND